MERYTVLVVDLVRPLWLRRNVNLYSFAPYSNCNTFSAALILGLTGQVSPGWINRTAWVSLQTCDLSFFPLTCLFLQIGSSLSSLIPASLLTMIDPPMIPDGDQDVHELATQPEPVVVLEPPPRVVRMVAREERPMRRKQAVEDDD